MKNKRKERLESKLRKLDSENDAKHMAYLNERHQILKELQQMDVEEAKSAAGEYYEKLVHVTSKCSDGRTEHYIGVIDTDKVDGSSFGFKRGVTHILTENGKACCVDYDDCRLLMVDADTRELFTSGKTTYADINPRFHHEVEIRCTSKEDEEEFVNSAYNERLLMCSNKIKLENKRSISAMAAWGERSGEC